MSRYVLHALIPLTAVLSACATPGGPTASVSAIPAAATNNASGANRANIDSIASDVAAITDSVVIPMPTELTRAVENRIDALRVRGGDCSRYGTVLENSFRSGRILLRPYMWRVGRNLTSGEAKPNGDMMLAREIDSLNVGVRTVDDVVFSMEHEAVHIAFDLASGNEFTEERANKIVRACKAPSRTIGGRDGQESQR